MGDRRGGYHLRRALESGAVLNVAFVFPTTGRSREPSLWLCSVLMPPFFTGAYRDQARTVHSSLKVARTCPIAQVDGTKTLPDFHIIHYTFQSASHFNGKHLRLTLLHYSNVF